MSDAAISYQYYRFFITKTFEDNYASIDQIKLYDNVSRSAVNLASAEFGATATASSQISTANKAGNVLIDTELWETANGKAINSWITIKFPIARPIRAFEMICTSYYPNETPVDYILQGSNNNTSWQDLYVNKDNLSQNTRVGIYLKLSGISLLDSGNRSSKVLIYDWASGRLLGNVTPKLDGNWFYYLTYDEDVFVTHLGTSGYEPKTDGPIKPYSEQ